MTQALSVRCQHCGAPLQISDALRFITCGYCHTELEVIRDASTIHTQLLGKIDARTAAMEGSLKVIELQNEIERLDREWEGWKQSNLDRAKDGSLSEPGAPFGPGGVFRLSLTVGLVVEVLSWILLSPAWAFLLGPVAFGFTWLVGHMQNSQAIWYQNSLNRFEKKRTALLLNLNKVRSAQ